MKYGSQLEKFFYETITHRLPVSISLDNRKVYVGYVWRLAPLDPHRADDYAVRLLPVRSGYRDEKTLELHFTTRYTEVYRQIGSGELGGVNHEDFLIVLPIKNIVSANLFALWIDSSLLRMPPVQTPEFVNPPPQTGEGDRKPSHKRVMRILNRLMQELRAAFCRPS
jgi:hypothetical protein